MENNSNNLAYPREGYYDKESFRQIPSENGLSKVELISAMALQGILANSHQNINEIDIIIQTSVEYAFLLLEKVNEISYNKEMQKLHNKK